MFNILSSSFLGIEIDIWTLIYIPIIILLFEIVKFIFSFLKKNFTPNKIDNYNIIYNSDIPNDEEIEDEQLTKSEDNTKYNANLNRILERHLKYILKKTGSDRVTIGKFHNGENGNEIYEGGNLWQKFSIIAEVYNYGISGKRKHVRNIPVAFYESLLKPLKENGAIIINNSDKLSTSDLRLFFKLQGTKSYGAIAIKQEDKFIGVLAIEFVARNVEINKETIQYLIENSHYFVDYIIRYYITNTEG